MTTNVSTARGPIKAIHIQVPVGIPTPDGGLEIPNRVFLGGIPTETTELELELFFSDFGMVKDVRIVTDRVTGESKGYGFVTFEETEDISSILRRKTINMKGKKLRVRKAIRRNGSQFQSSDSSGYNSSEQSPASSPSASFANNESVLFVPQQMPPQQVFPHQVGHFSAGHVKSQPLTIPANHLPPYQPMQPQYPVYCYQVMNAPPFHVPVNLPIYQHM